jgi:hypothetical protein
MATLYLTDMADYDVVNAVWDAWVPAGTAPAGPACRWCAWPNPAGGWRSPCRQPCGGEGQAPPFRGQLVGATCRGDL